MIFSQRLKIFRRLKIKVINLVIKFNINFTLLKKYIKIYSKISWLLIFIIIIDIILIILNIIILLLWNIYLFRRKLLVNFSIKFIIVILNQEFL